MNHSLLRQRLNDARLYLCTDARTERGDLAEFLDAALSGGVDIVQLRDKGLESRQELRYLETVRAACERHGALMAVNDRADIACAAGADVLHLGQNDLPVPEARSIIGETPLVGRSNNRADLAAASAQQEGVDYFCVGPAWETPTKPGRPAAGLSLVAEAAALGSSRPWFAIGGIDLENLGEVLSAGANRVVVVRAITNAEDPAAAAAEFQRRLSRDTAPSTAPDSRS
ncbi:thiamine-phosphate diphosphorylase [Haloactinospora alba]|uniref:Thiamine-phosphate synthase n=1 Tax=Haloactinospora alba TaxID=405555 RepID=A0A543NHM6_9ACTN|nr:thiamine phosphate synthase [Haloactinospora alba]TQN31333.1 thiamine-phosphate diphosphorylase [Haloactinospora alba]